MTARNVKVLKKGAFGGVKYACAKKYKCNEGELVLTQKDFTVNCRGNWSKVFRIDEVQFEVLDNCLEVRTIWYNKLVFTLLVDKPEEWKEALDKLRSDSLNKLVVDTFEREQNRKAEIDSLLQMDHPKIQSLYRKIRRHGQFDFKNIQFIGDIYNLFKRTKNRKLQAFIIAHCYVACYEWTKKLFYEIYKAKVGKGPANDEELKDFLANYPTWNFLTMDTWDIRANAIRNCVAHEKFYYDYQNSDIVLVVNGKEKRLKLIEMRLELIQLFNFYDETQKALKQKILACGMNVK
jgi:hypothetical protein